jgi:hypothetical protein
MDSKHQNNLPNLWGTIDHNHRRNKMTRDQAAVFILKRFHSMMGIMSKPDFEKCLQLVDEHQFTVTELLHRWKKLVMDNS